MAGELLTTPDAGGARQPPREAHRLTWSARVRQAMQVARQFLWGFFYFEMFHDLQKEKARYGDAVNLVILGELLGLPLMNSVITLRLLPYLLPELDSWKYRQLSEADIIEEAPEIH